MLFDTFTGKKGLSGKVICAFFVPLIEVLLYALFILVFYARPDLKRT
jgi:peptidoglycan biosynthesis protein MviN/MurJ (putative lipid II flippase)